MNSADFPWRPLGSLLVDEGVLGADDLERALAEQRRTGRLLGHVLVTRGYVTGVALAQALARQHGVDVRLASEAAADGAADASATDRATAWKPLGKVLVENAFVSAKALEDALAEQLERPGERLGEILVERGHLTGPALAKALAAQHGVDIESDEARGEDVGTTLRPRAADEPVYQVCDVAYEPAYRQGAVVYETSNFLEAADFACELVESTKPEAVEILKRHAGASETVWTYSESRAEATAASQERLVDTFGFDPMRWNARS
jgi:hypothetical protein